MGICFMSACGGESEGVTYNDEVKTTMSNYCVTCHSGSAPSAGLSLNTYANVKDAVENKGLLDRIQDENEPMPPGGLMPETEIQIIKDWMDGGFSQR